MLFNACFFSVVRVCLMAVEFFCDDVKRKGTC